MPKIFLTLIILILSFFSQNCYTWDGPTKGAIGHKNKKVIFISHDFKNVSIAEVFRDFQRAAKHLNWSVQFIDGKGFENIEKEFLQAIIQNPDAIILGGFQADPYKEILDRFKSRIVFVGWHAGPDIYDQNLFANITTKTEEVANLAADYVIKKSKQSANVVIFYDKLSSISFAKAEQMRTILQKCKTCEVLAFEDLSISEADYKIDKVVKKLNDKFGKKWNYTLAINDLYFDNINNPYKDIKRKDIFNVSAGDGSTKAFSRIRSGKSQQIATIAEPIGQQAWQLVDELNRAFSGLHNSGFISKPILVTKELLDKIGDDEIDSHLGYEKVYLKIWQVK